MKPLCIDLFCGLGGWTEGFLAEGYDVVGFDIERHQYGEQKYPAQLVLQDVLTLSGKQFSGAAVIVASPPCQEYSYMAMPWSRAKAKAAWYRECVTRQLELNCLFNACFRIAHEAGVPLIVENVRGAQPWVGQAAWKFGSFYLWGDLPALMVSSKFRKVPSNDTFYKGGGPCGKLTDPRYPSGRKVPMNFHEHEKTGKPGRSFQSAAVDGLKNARNWWSDGAGNLSATTSSHSPARKAASAQIAKIPLPLAQHIARCFK